MNIYEKYWIWKKYTRKWRIRKEFKKCHKLQRKRQWVEYKIITNYVLPPHVLINNGSGVEHLDEIPGVIMAWLYYKLSFRMRSRRSPASYPSRSRGWNQPGTTIFSPGDTLKYGVLSIWCTLPLLYNTIPAIPYGSSHGFGLCCVEFSSQPYELSFVTWTSIFRFLTLNGPFSAIAAPILQYEAPLESSWRNLQIPHAARDLNFQKTSNVPRFVSIHWIVFENF